MANAERAFPGGTAAGPSRPRAHTGLWAGVCTAAALFFCLLLLYAHRTAGPFAGQAVYAIRPEGGLQATVDWPGGAVDVNAADVKALETLSGVGPALALAIVDERTAAGPFDYPEDLTMVRGIGIKTLLKFYDQLDFSVRAAATLLP